REMTDYTDLKREVWDTERCSGCGACVGSCPLEALHFRGDDNPIYDGLCSKCSTCYSVCPRTRNEKSVGVSRAPENRDNIGPYIGRYFARSADFQIIKRAQGFGVVTSVLKYILDEKIVDAAIVVTADIFMNTSAMIARDFSDVKKSAKVKYIWAPVLSKLREAVLDESIKSIAVVGVPCVIQALEMIGRSKLLLYSKKIKLRLGLFCWEIFRHVLISEMIHKELQLDIDPRRIWMFDIRKRKLVVELMDSTEYHIPLETASKYARKGCSYCVDFTSEWSDISVGNAGAPKDFLTVITRTDLGERIIKNMIKKDLLVTGEFNEKVFSLAERVNKKKKLRIKNFKSP
ncbi:MAG: Coenzyme F420 hydrogenase/dehydrogenase, beta subunit C-terminal domain, partial [Candidatus Hydrothermarchaeales archaeon]